MSAHVLVVEDDAGLREALVDTLEIAGYQCTETESGEEAMLALKEPMFDIVVSDVQMAGMDGLGLLRSIRAKYPQLPVLLMTAYANVQDAVTAIRDGATDYLSKPFAPEVLLNQVSRYAPVAQVEPTRPVVADANSQALLDLAARVAQSDASVMVLGPSGAGKEVLARYIHDCSPRRDEAFVAINCAAIPENMLEATLFGYEKGAFTGAIQACPGKFEQAQGGTLLLDEITEMDMSLQAKLLRVLQEREVERLGSRKTITLDVRVLATSNRDLQQAVADGKFREDLFYRLNVFPLTWLPLAQRAADIVPLANHLIGKHCKRSGQPIPALSKEAIAKLSSYHWPGNVRELDNVIQRALILHQGRIEAADLLLEVQSSMMSNVTAVRPTVPVEQANALADAAVAADDLGSELRHQEHHIILNTLAECGGKRSAVAEKLGISARTLRYKIARMRDQGIDIPA
ncbi:sigma-54 dependent transcriptional regulator [Neiella marina]|uniref:Sigma-54 dependent transcriptional regulator n=1 Tax=Neiella holothuriorum TaxID=2870530 RepID=A0ABS7EFW0_9GAMM|nr:sigma-54 dependent transcriptional regulator [Neiella holothuriorum]MBW8190808.1 sigma-54 dependent transcriptional regulator [Neiella holothuriorum]